MKKIAKVVMLPTEKASRLYKDGLTGNLVYGIEPPAYRHDLSKKQHLYLVSDEEIKVGDWFIYNNQVEQCKSNSMGLIKSCNNNGRNPLELLNVDECKKIIATTDKSLTEEECSPCDGTGIQDAFTGTECDDCNGDGVQTNQAWLLPQIPKSFIESYVKANGKIDEVEVEYDLCEKHNGHLIGSVLRIEQETRIKTTESNEVIISLKEEDKLYTEKEVESKLQKFRLYSLKFGLDANVSNKWIKENL